MASRSELVYGVGVNDADYPVKIRANVGGKKKPVWVCPVHQAWKDMLKRCYSTRYQEKRQTYVGCSVAAEWHRFSVFREWMVEQDWRGNALDKDILSAGNKLYSPETCVFVSSRLNAFMTDSGATRGDFPIGVNWDKRDGKYRAQCCNPFTSKRESLGYFIDYSAAHEAWRKRKHELACIYAEQQTDPRIAKALRERYLKGADQ